MDVCRFCGVKILPLGILIASSGCMTQQMWRHATRDTLVDPRGNGCVGKPGAGDYAMVVCYGLANNTHEVEYLVPLNADGNPPYPFGVEGSDLLRISEKQEADILARKMPKVAGAVERHPFSIDNARTDAVAAPDDDPRQVPLPVVRVEYYLDPILYWQRPSK